MNMLVCNAFMRARTRLARQRAVLLEIFVIFLFLCTLHKQQAAVSHSLWSRVNSHERARRLQWKSLAGNMALMSPLWVKLECQAFQRLGWPHSSSMETCHVFLLLFLLHWGLWLPLTSTGLNSFHRWGKTPRIRKCHQSHKVLSSKWVKHQFWLNYPYNTSEVCTTIIQYQKGFIFWGLIPHQVLLFASKV